MIAAILVVSCGADTPEPALTETDQHPSPQGNVLATTDNRSISIDQIEQFLLTHRRYRTQLDQVPFSLWIKRLIGHYLLTADSTLHGEIADNRFRAQLAERMIGEDVQVPTDEEIDSFAETNGYSPEIAETRAFNQVLIAPDADGSCGAAQVLRDSVVGGASIEDVAREHSLSSRADIGGLVGPIKRDDLNPAAAELVFATDTGGTTDVLKDAAGCQFFTISRIQPGFTLDARLFRQRIGGLIIQQRRRTYFDALVESHGTVEKAVDALADTFATRFPEQYAELRRVNSQQIYLAQELTRRMRDELDALDESVLERHYHRYPHRFSSQSELSLTVKRWNLVAKDRFAVQREAREWVANPSLRSDDWRTDDSVEIIGRRPLSWLAENRPELSVALVAGSTEDEWFGPFRSGDQLIAVHVDAMIPANQLSFAETRLLVRQDYSQAHSAELEAAMLDRYAKEIGLKIQSIDRETFLAKIAESFLP